MLRKHKDGNDFFVQESQERLQRGKTFALALEG